MVIIVTLLLIETSREA